MPLRLLDAAGKLTAGIVAEPDPLEPLAATLLYVPPMSPSHGDSFTLRVQREVSEPKVRYRWAQLPTDRFVFESVDCTGQAYIEVPVSMPGRRFALLDTQTNLLYLSEPDPTVVAKTLHSLRYPLQPCDLDAGTENFLGVAVEPVIDMDDVFTPPFEIR
jgi:hypothetical protein